MAKTLLLENGKRYEARLHVAWYENAASDEKIIGEATKLLVEAKFERINVWKADGHWFAAGFWTGPTQTEELPERIEDAWAI